MTANLSQEIQKIGQVLGTAFGPVQVILFGSHAYGQPDADSDLDICVILDLAGKRKIEWTRKIRRALSGHVSSPLDILVYSPEEFRSRARLNSTLEYKILTQGIQLNEQQGHRAGMV